MFRASIWPSSGVLGCIRIILLHMVSSTIKENCALVGCHNVLYVYIAGIRGGCGWSSVIRIQPNTPEDGHI